MKTLTRKEIVALGATFPYKTPGLDGRDHQDMDRCLLNGREYLHEANDYQEGAGNHSDYQLFRLTGSGQDN